MSQQVCAGRATTKVNVSRGIGIIMVVDAELEEFHKDGKTGHTLMSCFGRRLDKVIVLANHILSDELRRRGSRVIGVFCRVKYFAVAGCLAQLDAYLVLEQLWYTLLRNLQARLLNGGLSTVKL